MVSIKSKLKKSLLINLHGKTKNEIKLTKGGEQPPPLNPPRLYCKRSCNIKMINKAKKCIPRPLAIIKLSVIYNCNTIGVKNGKRK